MASNVVKPDTGRARSRISAPSALNAPERALFNELINNNGHLKPGDAPFLAAFVQAMMKVNKLARKTDAASIKSWEMTSRVMLSMGTKLRITAQATTHHITAGRARNNLRTPSYYETMDSDE